LIASKYTFEFGKTSFHVIKYKIGAYSKLDKSSTDSSLSSSHSSPLIKPSIFSMYKITKILGICTDVNIDE